MSVDWQRVDPSEFLRDVARAATETYKLEPHAWAKSKRLPWIHCRRCGLVSLRNPLTAWCERVGCLFELHPEFRARLRAVVSPRLVNQGAT